MNTACVLSSLVAATISVAGTVPAVADTQMWVAAEDLERHTCPSAECGVVGRFYFKERVFVYETMKGWSRVSPYQAAGCYDGRSSYVEVGRSECTIANGIDEGEFAEWVRTENLSKEQPEKPYEVHG
ncbi:hypothetical protein [Mesorhizobium xinjiangense]|uniref:hypothetical protein n=1 Tax=Mesorhizobium xinjiangense TaxID=2678685 RepID=UPI0012EDD0C1|nr:hypothetical protein [Mesorhizobium xinjiangense]